MARPGFILCVSPDEYLTRVRINRALAENAPHPEGGLRGASAPIAWERHAFWGDDPLPGAFWDSLTLQGLFASPKALIVHNAHAILADAWRNISVALAAPNSDVWPFFCLRVAFERGKPKVPAHIANLACYAFAAKKDWLWIIPGLDEKNKARFVREEAGKRSLSFAPGALESITAALPFDAAAIGTQLDKLALAAGKDGLLTPDLAEILDREIAPDIFSLIKDLQQGRATAVWEQALLSERGSDSMAFAFLATLAREARQLWQIALGEPAHLPPHVLAVKTPLARSLGTAKIASLWHLALEADKGVKTGERSPDQALDSVLSSLSLLFCPRTSRR